MHIRARQCLSSAYEPVSRKIKQCRQCEKVFIGTQRMVFCSEKCCDQWQAKHRKPRPHRVRKPVFRGPFKCKQCNKNYMTSRRRGEGEMFCSRECAFEYKHVRSTTFEYSKVYLRHCLVCGRYFVGRKKCDLMCSQACTREKKQETERIRARLKYLDDHKANGKVTFCDICNISYCLMPGTKQMKYCSNDCYKKSNAYLHKRENHRKCNRIRRHQSRSTGFYELFDPLDVFKRDRWRCNGCGRKTPVSKRGTMDDNAPELDHILPLSKGGTHTRSNVQLLCRRCNNLKSDGALHDQMLLIG